MPRWARIAIVVGAIVLGQVVLYGPSLAGSKILLPLDLLAQPGWYAPPVSSEGADGDKLVIHNRTLSDLVLTFEPRRQFAAAELRAGRIPLWNPYNFAGSPTADLFSPFDLLYYAFPSPFMLAWLQVLKSLVAGLGAYVFFRRVLAVGFRPAAIGAACYPVTGFLVLWQGYPLSATVAFLPWILLATDRAMRRPRGWGGPALAVLVSVVFAAEIGTSGQMLLAAGIYALWCAFDQKRFRGLGVAAGAVVLGLMIAMPPILPLSEYLTTGVRSTARVEGAEERPPVGIAALPQTVLPDMYGSWQSGSRRIVSGNRLESSAAGYAGVIATLVLAPLAFGRSRRLWLLWSSLALLGVGWTINLPGLVQLLRLPGLNLLSHNRFVFLSGFALLALAVMGLAQLEERSRPNRVAASVGIGLLIGLAGWCVYRLVVPPDGLPDAGYARAVVLCGLGGCVWVVALSRKPPRWLVPGVGALVLVDLLSFGYGIAPQSDPKLAYPDIPALSEVAARPGRALCIACLPPALNRRFSLRDIRGYDGVDPARMIELLERVADPKALVPPYARTMWFRPKWIRRLGQGEGVRLPPALDMLGVRYIIRRGSPPQGGTPPITSPGYWVMENPAALPRAFVPRRVVRLGDREERLAMLGSDDFDPRALAILEVDVPEDLPEASAGSAIISSETPQEIAIELDMRTPGLVVLADAWDAGWTAAIAGVPTPILRANHVLRGVVAPAGRSTLVFRYQPTSFRVGLALMTVALPLLAVWCASVVRANRRVPGA